MTKAIGVCHISTFCPTQCGIATYVQDLIDHLRAAESFPLRLVYEQDSVLSTEQTICIPDERSYEEAARAVNRNRSIELVSLQHEFGIFGGLNGAYAVQLARAIKKPIVTTLHTVTSQLNPTRGRIIGDLAAASSSVVVLSRESAATLVRDFKVAISKINVIEHGICEVPFQKPETLATRKEMNSCIRSAKPSLPNRRKSW